MGNPHACETLGLDMILCLKQTFTCLNCFHIHFTYISYAFHMFASGSDIQQNETERCSDPHLPSLEQYKTMSVIKDVVHIEIHDNGYLTQRVFMINFSQFPFYDSFPGKHWLFSLLDHVVNLYPQPRIETHDKINLCFTSQLKVI